MKAVGVVVAGGGSAGYSAAMAAKKVGAEVTLIERMDVLGGLGLVCGVTMRGAATAVLAEDRALGGGDMADLWESIAIHRDIEVPGGDIITTYDVTRLDAAMQRALKKAGVKVLLRQTVADVQMSGAKVEAVVLRDGSRISADAFVDATGATEGPSACHKWGRGCVECILRRPVFGAPGGIVDGKAKTVSRLTAYGTPGVTGTSVMLSKSSLSPAIQEELRKKCCVAIPIPSDAAMDEDRMKRAGTAVLLKREFYRKHIVLTDVGGYAKIPGSGSPLMASGLRNFPGLEDAFICQPAAGAIGHLVCWTTMALRDNSLKVNGFENVFCAGTKAGLMNLISTVPTGDLAGHNAVRSGLGQPCLELPKTLMIGAFIDLAGEKMRTEEGLKNTYGLQDTKLLKDLKVYREDRDEIVKEVEKVGLKNIYRMKLCG